MKFIESSVVVSYVNELFGLSEGLPTDKQARLLLAMARKHNVDVMYAITETHKAWSIMPFKDVIGKIVEFIEGGFTVENNPDADPF
jgi:hypothetical protein